MAESTFSLLEFGVFAYGEYIHTLRLTSELVDLRVECANPVTSVAEFESTPHCTKNKSNPEGLLLFLA